MGARPQAPSVPVTEAPKSIPQPQMASIEPPPTARPPAPPPYHPSPAPGHGPATLGHGTGGHSLAGADSCRSRIFLEARLQRVTASVAYRSQFF